jgi:hypothetical protein
LNSSSTTPVIERMAKEKDQCWLYRLRPEFSQASSPAEAGHPSSTVAAERLDFLMAPFRVRQLNPTAWDEKDSFWSTLVQDWLAAAKPILFTSGQAQMALARPDGRTAEGLPEVLARMASSGLHGLVEADTIRRQLSNASWSWQLMSSLASVATKRIWGQRVGSESVYVSKANLDWWCSKVGQELLDLGKGSDEQLQAITVAKASILTQSEVDRHLQKLGLSKEEASLCLAKLVKEGRLCLHSLPNHGKFVKLTLAPSGQCPQWTNMDTAAVRLAPLLAKLNKDVEAKEEQRVNLTDQIKLALSAKDKDKAKFILIRRKRLDSQLDQRRKLQLNLEELAESLSSAVEEAEVVQCYTSGVKALKEVLPNHQEAADVLDEIKEALDEAKDLSSLLSTSVSSSSASVEDEEVEAELMELIADEESEANLLDQLDKLKVEDQRLPSGQKKRKHQANVDKVPVLKEA